MYLRIQTNEDMHHERMMIERLRVYTFGGWLLKLAYQSVEPQGLEIGESSCDKLLGYT